MHPNPAEQDEALTRLIRLKLREIQDLVRTNHQADLKYSDTLVALLAKKCVKRGQNEHVVDDVIEDSLLDLIAKKMLLASIEEQVIRNISLFVDRLRSKIVCTIG